MNDIKKRNYKIYSIIFLVWAVVALYILIRSSYTYIVAISYSKYDTVVGEVLEASEAEGTIYYEENKNTGEQTDKGGNFTQTIKFKYEYNGKEYTVEDKDREISLSGVKIDGKYVTDRYYEKGSEIELYVKDDKWMEVAKVKKDSDIVPVVCCLFFFAIPLFFAIFMRKKLNKLIAKENANTGFDGNGLNIGFNNSFANNGMNNGFNNNGMNNGFNNMQNN